MVFEYFEILFDFMMNKSSANSGKMQKLCRALRKAKDLTMRKMSQQPEYQKAWKKYEKVLMYRSNFLMISMLMLQANYYMTD